MTEGTQKKSETPRWLQEVETEVADWQEAQDSLPETVQPSENPDKKIPNDIIDPEAMKDWFPDETDTDGNHDPEVPAMEIQKTALEDWAKKKLAWFGSEVREEEKRRLYMEYLEQEKVKTKPTYDEAITIVQERINALELAKNSPEFPNMFTNEQLDELLAEYLVIAEIIMDQASSENKQYQLDPQLEKLNELLYALYNAKKDSFRNLDKKAYLA
ncbi:hypothetical protein KC571_03535 [candidate division WWE3 bacterium]|uniref:Uncharacterized protein n=1 Tax=candidate division WWE3 bacterium TaxID=2053526 RepID=A0A955LH85_UNCKA|nr:hypothetical protein [candidate division WWE3 bacterium]